MSQSSFFQTDVSVRMPFAAVTTSFLTLLTTMLTGTILAEDSAVVSNRLVLVTCDLHENFQAGTLISRLLDHNLTLQNFRVAEPQDSSIFTVDSHDGSVCINRDDQTDFESHRNLRFRILADEDLAEQDPFLAEFSAGLLEDGLTTEAFRSLSTGTVTFDITIQLRDVPEPPQLLDANLVVQVLNDSETEFGTVACISRQSSEELHYFIASGNEDEVFRINTHTGTLSLRGGDARRFDMISTHELVILAENSAGLSATANVMVSIFNETPQSIPAPGRVATQVSEQDSAPEPSGRASVSSTASVLPFELPFVFPAKPKHGVESGLPSTAVPNTDSEATPAGNATGDTTGHFLVKNTSPDSAITHPALPTLNLETIDMVEVSNWVSPIDDNEDAATKSAVSLIATKPELFLPVSKAQSASKRFLPSLVALIVFVISSVVAAVAFSRAVAARKAILEETSARNAAESLVLVDMEPDPPACRPVTQHWAEHSEQISQLQDQLASSEQLIAQLTKELHAVGKPGFKLTTTVDDSDCGDNEDSRHNLTTSAANDHQPMHDDTVLQQISQTIESQTDVRSSLMTARERLERELTGNKRTMPACSNNVASQTDLRYESTASATATLEKSEDMRTELADLFGLHAVEKNESEVRLSEVATDSATAKSAQTDDESEVTHLDSVKRYLAQLLERSNDAASTEDTLVDRRKSDSQDVDSDRQTTREPARKPVKSFLDFYMETHGGELTEVTDSSPHQMSVDVTVTPPQPVKPRTPVDVQSIRESMNSFRAVAIQSVENAVLSHDLRLAKGKVAVWTMVIAGLIAMTLLVFLANMMKVIQLNSLNWLMVTIVALALIELGLRIQSIRRQREHRSAAMLTSGSALHSIGSSDDGGTLDELSV